MGDESQVARYANFFSIGHNHFEFVLECGQFHEGSLEPAVHTRIVSTPAYAKMLSTLLAESLHRYEIEFGPIPDADSEEPQQPC
ncbi:MAG TPA: DUF3467 domain-containing protein [Candidatus Angelobacter sp.]|jgi:hypothetical protein|nr:DUF3467 domain-containing protein [Candidatus Angelobacter sp.]